MYFSFICLDFGLQFQLYCDFLILRGHFKSCLAITTGKLMDTNEYVLSYVLHVNIHVKYPSLYVCRGCVHVQGWGGGVCVCMVSMYGYAFHHALTYRAETWQGHRGWAPKVCGYIFEVIPPKVKGHPKVKVLLKCSMATKFGRKNP